MSDIGVNVVLSLVDQLSQRLRGTVNNARTELKKLDATAIKDRGAELQKQAEMYANVVKVGSAGLIPLVTAQGAAFKMYADHQYDIKYISTLIDDVNFKYDDLSKNLRGIAMDTGKTIHDVSRATYQALSSGISKDMVADFVRSASKAAVAGGAGMETAITPILAVLNAYGLKASDATKISDQLFSLVKDGVIEFNQLTGAIANFASTGSLGKFDLVEQLAAIAALTKGGVSPDEAGTAVNAMLLSIIAATDDVKEYAKNIGIDFSYEKAKEVGILKFLQDIKEATDGNVVALQTLFSERRALKAVGILAGEGAQNFKNAANMIQNSAGATEQAFAKMEDSARTKMQKMKETFSSIGIDVGEIVYDSIEEPLNGLSKSLRDFADNESGIKTLASALKILTGVFGALIGLGAVGKVLTTAKGMGLAFTAAKMGAAIPMKGMLASGAYMGGKMAVGSIPVVGQVALVGAAAYAVGKTADTIAKNLDLSAYKKLDANRQGVSDSIGMDYRELQYLQGLKDPSAEQKKMLDMAMGGKSGLLGEMFNNAMKETDTAKQFEAIRLWEEQRKMTVDKINLIEEESKALQEQYRTMQAGLEENRKLQQSLGDDALQLGFDTISRFGESIRMEMEYIEGLRKMIFDQEWAKVSPLDQMRTAELIYQARNPKTDADTPYAFINEESVKYLRELVEEQKNSNHLAKMFADLATKDTIARNNQDFVIKNISINIQGDGTYGRTANVRVERENSQTPTERMLDINVINRGGVFPE